MYIRKGDDVMMLVGKDRGKSGKVLRVFPKDKSAIIEGLNLVKKHRRSKRQGQKGEVISAPRPVDWSNAMLICRHCKKPSRTGIKFENGKKIRVCKKCGKDN